jgi:hypothetical protein
MSQSFPPPPPASPSVPPAARTGAGAGAAAALSRNPLGLAALWVGIGAFVAALIPFVSYAAILAALVGIGLGVIALVLPARRKRAATAGAIVSGVALLVSIVLSVVYTVVLFGSLIGAVGDPIDSPPAPLDSTSIPLSYQVDGSGSDVDITYTTSVDGVQSTQQETAQRLPFEREFTVAFGGADTYTSYTLTAVNGDSDGDVRCRIALDDRVLIERSASGPYATATCTVSGTELLEQ